MADRNRPQYWLDSFLSLLTRFETIMEFHRTPVRKHGICEAEDEALDNLPILQLLLNRCRHGRIDACSFVNVFYKVSWFLLLGMVDDFVNGPVQL